MPGHYDDIRTAFGHPIVTKKTTRERAACAYKLANQSTSLSAALEAIDFADSILTGESSFRKTLLERWEQSATESWLPPANFRPVPPEVKIFKKGSVCMPQSHRYIGLQLKRAASLDHVATTPQQLLRDVVVAHSRGTFDDPRPIKLDDRIQLLKQSPLALYEAYLSSKRASELYSVLNTFNAGITSANPVMRWALERQSIGVTTALPVHSYTAITRRAVAPKVTTEPVTRGIPDTCLSAFAAKQLRHVTKGGTAKRLKLALSTLDQSDIDAVAAAVSHRAAPRPRPLTAEEFTAQTKLPQTLVMWCGTCNMWRFNTGKTPSITVDLLRPKVGLCGGCRSELTPVSLNGHIIGTLRMCSQCGVVMSGAEKRYQRGLLTLCNVCTVALDTVSRSCVRCGSVATKYVLASGPTEFTALYLCSTHYPGPYAYDPLSSVTDVLEDLC
ncbi:MAG: hypothetical protein ACPGR8_15325 [Limisphaerales bacterium]